MLGIEPSGSSRVRAVSRFERIEPAAVGLTNPCFLNNMLEIYRKGTKNNATDMLDHFLERKFHEELNWLVYFMIGLLNNPLYSDLRVTENEVCRYWSAFTLSSEVDLL